MRRIRAIGIIHRNRIQSRIRQIHKTPAESAENQISHEHNHQADDRAGDRLLGRSQRRPIARRGGILHCADDDHHHRQAADDAGGEKIDLLDIFGQPVFHLIEPADSHFQSDRRIRHGAILRLRHHGA